MNETIRKHLERIASKLDTPGDLALALATIISNTGDSLGVVEVGAVLADLIGALSTCGGAWTPDSLACAMLDSMANHAGIPLLKLSAIVSAGIVKGEVKRGNPDALDIQHKADALHEANKRAAEETLREVDEIVKRR